MVWTVDSVLGCPKFHIHLITEYTWITLRHQMPLRYGVNCELIHPQWSLVLSVLWVIFVSTVQLLSCYLSALPIMILTACRSINPCEFFSSSATSTSNYINKLNIATKSSVSLLKLSLTSSVGNALQNNPSPLLIVFANMLSINCTTLWN